MIINKKNIIKNCLLTFLLFYGYFSFAQNSNQTIFISKDSLYFTFNEDWKFFSGDSVALASRDYDDSNLPTIKSELRMDKIPPDLFKGIGWFRIHFIADSSITNRPMVLSVRQTGASEIYLDGKLIKSYGLIKDSASSIYYNPQELPFVITLDSAGAHVFAVRYANYDALKNFKVYRQSFAGFKLILDEPDRSIETKDSHTLSLSVILITLMGIFFVLCLLHFFLFVFYPLTRSNLYFSVLMLCLGLGFLIGFISFFHHSPTTIHKWQYFSNFVLYLGELLFQVFIDSAKTPCKIN